MPDQPIKSRLVLYFPGFEAIGAMAQLGRLKYNAEKSASYWDYTHKEQSINQADNAPCAVSTNKTTGKDWNVDTRVILFDWSDIASSYLNAPYPNNLFKYLPVFLTFFIDGTNFRYFKASKRYWIFSIFPLAIILAFLIASWFAVSAILTIFASGLSGWMLLLAQISLTAVMTMILCKWPGDRLYINMAISMSGFIRKMALGTSAENNKRCKKFVKILTKEIEANSYDEILVVTHSIGVLWSVKALSKALKEKPHLISGSNITFLALGSNLPRSGLVPAAQHVRDDLQHIMSFPDLFWHEFYSKDDLVSFYKADTMKILGVVDPKASYLIDRIRFKYAMEAVRYRNMRKSFYRTHKQFVLYYDKPVYFDLILRIFGPLSAKQLAYDRELIEPCKKNQKPA